jgi:D-alanyl-D-alanine dipeptidase
MLSRLCASILFLLVGAGKPCVASEPGPPGPGWVDVRTLPHVQVDLRYATANNFTHSIVYPTQNCFLRQIAAEKLSRAAESLQIQHPGWSIVVFDALRPRSAQWILWKKVAGTAQQKYVGDPREGSLHNVGLAVDLSLLDGEGKELDMGTPFDSFQLLAQPKLEDGFVKDGTLSLAAHHNRETLRALMKEAGFVGIAIEWWHFQAMTRAQANGYAVVE